MAAEHNAIKYGLGLVNSLGAFIGLGDEEQGTTRLSETLQPTFDVFGPAELAVLQGKVFWSLMHQQASVALELSFVGLRNPAGSNLIAVVLGWRVKSTTAQEHKLFHGAISATDVDGAEQLVPRDTRLPLAGVSQLVKIHGAGVAAIGNDALEQLTLTTANLSVDFFAGRVITPGFELRSYNQTVNTDLGVTAYGYFRSANPGEITGRP